MKKHSKKLSPLAIALSAGAAISLTNVTSAEPVSSAVFTANELDSGYRVQQTSYYERRDGEQAKDKKGKEGKCGKDKKGKEGKCGKDKKASKGKDGKCGAGKCGS